MYATFLGLYQPRERAGDWALHPKSGLGCQPRSISDPRFGRIIGASLAHRGTGAVSAGALTQRGLQRQR